MAGAYDYERQYKKEFEELLVKFYQASADMMLVRDFMSGDIPVGFAGEIFLREHKDEVLEEAKRRYDKRQK